MALLITAAEALVRGQEVPHEAAVYLGTAIADWLRQGGSLEREHLRVSAVRGSHATASAIAKALIEPPHRDEAIPD